MVALPINLQNLLRHRTVESERIEYKTAWNPDAIIRTLCAFANDFENLGGGYIIIGQDCDANGRPVLVVLHAPGGMHRPYKAPSSVSSRHKSWHYYIRRYSSTVEARGDCEQELLSLTANVPFDDRMARQAQVSDLSKPLMLAYLQEVGSALADYANELSIEELGRQMNVVDGPSEYPCPKNVGLMFFSETPDRFFPYTQIDVVWFPDGPGGDHFDEKIFKGPLARTTREALGYIERNYLHQAILKHPDRAEATRVWNFPYPAIEEAVVNAVYHQGRSTGVPKIFKAMAANGSPPPQFDTDDDRSGCLVRLPVHPLAQWPVDQSTPEVTPQVTPQVTPEVRSILDLLVAESTRLQLQEALGLKDSKHFRKTYLLPAIAAGLVAMTQPDAPRSRSQRYRLTPKGQQWLKQHADD
ncbi:transcriptional regulator [Rugamonas sp. FT82W]|uniref:Transcriptional regulator n=1 Tax=Duganella vulcania TaxID=2692166 RepID=A0A845G8S7_9BURK|nr:transcriptional regulator [Duganella vulcania]MYM90704.1 transcriptional regulator [Duganella vulcania]